MKNIMKVALLMLLAGSIASCNLDKYPDGDAIPEEQAFTTFQGRRPVPPQPLLLRPSVFLVVHRHPGEHAGGRYQCYAGLR